MQGLGAIDWKCSWAQTVTMEVSRSAFNYAPTTLIDTYTAFILVCSTAWNEPSYPLFQYSGLSSATSSRTGQTGESRSTMFEETQAIVIKGQPTSLTESIQGNPSQLSATITEFPILSGVSNSSSHCSPSTIIIQTTMRTS